MQHTHTIAAIVSAILFVTPNILIAQRAKTKGKSDTLTYTVPSVTVTSTRAEEGKTPVTFSEITRADLQQQHTVTDLPALLATLPSTIFFSDNGNAVGYSTLTMRGFDQRRISVLINGIPQNDPEDHNVYWINFPDLASNLENIQVQRGAGLANYGAAAIGGSVNLTTTNFANKKFVRASTGIGYQEFRGDWRNDAPASAPVNAMTKHSVELSSGLVETASGGYAVYARLSQIQSRGYRDNAWADLTSYFLSAARFGETFTTQINVFGGPVSDGLAYTGLPKAWTTDPVLRRANLSAFGYDSTGRNLDYTVRRRYQEIENFSQPHVELLNDVQLSDNITLKSSLFYYTGTGFFDFDGSWADTTTLRLGAAFSGVRPTANPGNTIIRAFVGNRQGGWIPRFIINHDKGELTVGAEYREHRSEHWGKIRFADNLPAGLDPDYKIYSYNGTRTILSGFVREQYRASETLLLNAEAQLVHSRYGLMNERAGTTFTSYQSADGSRVGNGGTIFTVDYFFINPRLGAMYAADDANNLYTSIAYTSREPRRNNLYAASESYFGASPLFESDTTGGVIKYDFTRPLIKPEHLLNWEFGWTYKTPAIQLGATGYVMYFINELVRSGRRDIFGAPIEGNAPRVIHTGIELQGSGVLYSSGATIFAVTANATFSRNRIIEYQFQTSGSSLDLNGNPVAGFPDMMGNLRFSLTSGTFQAGLALRHVGRMYSDNFGSRIDEYVRQSPGFIGYRDNLVDAFTVANADISYSIGSLLGIRSLRFRLVVNNLFNTLYVSGANGAEFFPAAERNWFSGLEVEL